jgi:3-deoxy-D-arabino-heptulosonate 7-phosphate (DAHP) synthase
MAATLEEWLSAAESINAEGNQNIILCECGSRTFSHYSRYTLDLSIIPAVRSCSRLPVIFDPSNGTGANYMVRPLVLAGVAVGSDGFMVEIHDETESVRCNCAHAITFDQYEKLMIDVRAVRAVMTTANLVTSK